MHFESEDQDIGNLPDDFMIFRMEIDDFHSIHPISALLIEMLVL